MFKKKSNIPRRRLTDEGASQKAVLSDVFRRNQTLTGTTSSSIGDVNTTTNQSPRSKAHHLTLKRRKVMIVLLVIFLSVITLWVLVSNFTARAVVVVSDTTISRSIDLPRLEKFIQEYLDNNPMGRFSFLLDQSALNTYLSNKAPEVLSVTQQGMLSIGDTGFNIAMRVPVAGWNINDKQYYVDSAGVSFENNYFAAPAVQIIDGSGISLQPGTVSVSNRFLGFVGQVVALSKSSGYTVTQAILPVNTTRELEVKLKEGDYLVKMSIDRPAGEQVEDMSRAVRYFTSHGGAPSYIDVRVSGKAFYK
jgi:hypothetical protein